MSELTAENLRALMQDRQGPCVSLFMPTHQAGPKVRENHIRFKNLLREAEAALTAHGMRERDAEALLKPAWSLVEDRPFWQEQSTGLAAFLRDGRFEHYSLPVAFEELSVVTSHFHVKPLLQLFSSDGTFYILALSRKNVRLLRSSHHTIERVPLRDIPANIAEALAQEGLVDITSRGSHAQPGPEREHRQGAHGTGLETENERDRALMFCRKVDKGVRGAIGSGSVPLVFAGDEALFPIYEEANSHQNLLEAFIPGNPDRVSDQELHDRAWALVEPVFSAARQGAAEECRRVADTKKGGITVQDVVPAACNARVAVLFVAINTHVWGTHDEATGQVDIHESRQPLDEDLLDLAAERTLANGGTVYAVPPDEVPCGGVIAATFRF